MQTRTERIAG